MRSADIITFTGLSMIATSLKSTISIKNLYNLYELCQDFFLLQNETQSSDFLLRLPLWDDFSEDAELSSLVSIEPQRNCSQWLSSVSDMKEWAPACLTAPGCPQTERWGKKDARERKKVDHLYCKKKEECCKSLCMCRHTVQPSASSDLWGFYEEELRPTIDDTKVQSVWFVKHIVFIFNSLYFCFLEKIIT